MGNRKQPFGYRMTLGEITIQPEEAELVRFIFQGYSTGATLGELTKALCRQEIPYYEGRTWNKNMVSRILEDSRYIGEKGYPALIEPEQLRTAAEKRTARACPPQKTPAQKTLRRLCGAPPSERVEKIVTDLLNELIRCPDRIQPAASQMAAACGKTREDLTTALERQPIDEDNATAHLTWQAPKASEYTVEKYLVFRGGKQIAETKATSYDDTNIPEGDYEYNVKTVYTDGFVSLPIAVAVSYGEEIVYGLPFNEDFNSGLLPADWAVERINESMKTDYLWRFDNWFELPVAGGGFEGNFASICSSISPLVNMFSALETPCLYSKLQADEKVFIDFDIDYCTVDKATGQKSEAGLKYSYNKQAWADVCDAFDGYHVEDLAAGETCKPQHLSFDVTSCFAENSPLYFAWFYNAKKAQHIAIDNVKIYIVNGSGIQSTETTANQADAPIYSLSGQRVAGDRSSLQPGVYVQNGKKIVVK